MACGRGFNWSHNAFSLLSLSVVFLMATTTGTSSLIDVRGFFPEINIDLTKVSWAHAVNSEESLTAAIKGADMMLEADILIGTTPASSDQIPVMAHPPQRSSNLSFRGFLDTVIKCRETRKGIKLDFKELDAVEPVLKMLEAEFKSNRLTFPVWLNADVLKGPVNSTKEPVNGNAFIALVKKYLPSATLSLGWTTRYGRDDIRAASIENREDSSLRTIKSPRSGYTEQHISDMVQLIQDNNWDGQVTFAVRAGLLTSKESRTQLGRLTTETMLDSVTFTIWSPVDDPVNVQTLSEWISFTQKGSVYVDLPFDLQRGPILIPDFPERDVGRTDHLQSSSSSSSGYSSTNLAIAFLLTTNIFATSSF